MTIVEHAYARLQEKGAAKRKTKTKGEKKAGKIKYQQKNEKEKEKQRQESSTQKPPTKKAQGLRSRRMHDYQLLNVKIGHQPFIYAS